MSPEFLLTALIVCLVPGIGVVYTLSATLGAGFRAGIMASAGCTIATVLHLVVALSGLAAVLYTSAILFQAIKYAGVAYLIWMAWAILGDRGSLSVKAAEPQSARVVVRRGIALNILNPKLPLFFIAFLPQFLPAEKAGALPAMIELGLAFSALTFLTFAGYAALAALGRNAVLGRPAVLLWLKRAFAASFAALGLRLALERA